MSMLKFLPSSLLLLVAGSLAVVRWRALRLVGVAALALMPATGANAGTIDVIFTGGCTRGNGTGSCAAPLGATIAATIKLTTALGDTPLGGQPANSYDVSLLMMPAGGVTLVPMPPAANTPPPGWSPGLAGVLSGNLYSNIVSGSDILGLNPLPVPSMHQLGSLLLTVDGTTLLANPQLVLQNPLIIGGNGLDVTSEYTLNAGVVTLHAPLPTLSGMSLSYFEEFTAEFGLPTTPEVDLLSAGSVATYQSGNGPPAAPTIFDDVSFAVMAVDGVESSELQGMAVVTIPIAETKDVAVRVQFDNAASTTTAPYFLQQSALLAFDDGMGAALDFAIFASLVSFDVGSPIVQFQLKRLDVSSGMTTTMDAATVPPALLTELALGQPFVVTLRLDRSIDEATAHIISGASELLLTGVTDIAGQQVVGANAEILVLNTLSGVGSTGEDDSNAVDVRDIAVFLPAPLAVPVSKAFGTASLAAFLLLMGLFASIRRQPAL